MPIRTTHNRKEVVMYDLYEVRVLGTQREIRVKGDVLADEVQTWGIYTFDDVSEYQAAHRAAKQYASVRRLVSHDSLVVIVRRSDGKKWCDPVLYEVAFVDEEMAITDADGLQWRLT